MGSVEFHCSECGKLQRLTDPNIVSTGNTKGWLCSRCIGAFVREAEKEEGE
jgi:hypothetical protein